MLIMQPWKFRNFVVAIVFLSVVSPIAMAETREISSTFAQTTTQSRKIEADSLLERGVKQLDNKQAEAALQSFQQALAIYQEIKDLQGEGNTLKRLGDACLSLKEHEKAIAFYQQSLALVKAVSDRELEGRVLNNLGLAYKELGDSTKAIEYYQQALAIAKEINNRKLQQTALNNLGYIYVVLENPAKVVEYYQQVLAISQELQDRSTEASALALLGAASASLNDNQKAIEFAQQALTLARKTKNSQVEAIALDTLVSAYSSLNDAQKTLEFGKQALTLARQLKNQLVEVRALAFIGDASASLNNHQKAIEFAQQALKMARETKNSGAEAVALDTLTRAYNSLFNAQKTLEFAQQALLVARQIKNQLIEVRALAFIGDAYRSLKDNQKAIEFAQQALTLAREIKNIQLEGFNLATLGIAYSSIEDNIKALELAQQSLVIAQQIKKPELECRALFALAIVYAKEDLQKSIDSVNKCLAISQEIKNTQLELTNLVVFSVFYLTLGDYQKGSELNQRGLVISQKIKNQRFEVLFQMFQTMTYLYQKDSQKAIDSAQQLLRIAQTNKSREVETIALSLMGAGYGDLGNYKKAIELSEKGLAIARKESIRSVENLTLGVLADIYSKVGRKKEALVIYRDLASTDSNNLASQVSLARTYRDLNLPLTAITYYKEAVNKIEKYRLSLRGMSIELQESFLKKAVFGYVDKLKRADTYRELADLLLSQGRILEAQQVLELLKTQELRDFTGNMRAGGKKPEISFNQTEEQIKKENGTLIAFGQRLYECQQTQCKQLSQLLDQRQTLTEQYNQKIQTIEKEIRERRAKDDAFFDPNKLSKAKEIVEAQPGTLLIYPLVLPDKIWLLWTAQGGIVKSVEVPNVGQKQIGETVLKFRQLLQNPNSDITQLKATSKQLYDWLIKPIEPELKQNRIQNLVFSLDRATRYIPMSALFDGEKYLVENYAVSLVLSADLTDTKDRLPPGTQNTPVLALGLSKAVAGYNALPNVPAELNAIVRKKTNDTTGIYPGLEFLNETFDFRALRDNLIGRKILHVATHGQFVPGRQEDSYLLLGKGEKLTITQIKTLQDLSNIHLVVLSACETALGEPNQDGIEINGISFSFLNAGAKAVMASLWLVNDASTSKLMQHFYSNLAQDTKPITKAAALRQAQLSLLRGEPAKTETTDKRSLVVVQPDEGWQAASTNRITSGFSHPYYWAPFILIGNGL